jgi:hypothetical protein
MLGIAVGLLYSAKCGALGKRVVTVAVVALLVIGVTTQRWHWPPSFSSSYEVYEVEACMAYKGAASCHRAFGSTQELARLNAISEACSQITRAGADYIACEDLTPLRVTQSPIPLKKVKWILNEFGSGNGMHTD